MTSISERRLHPRPARRLAPTVLLALLIAPAAAAARSADAANPPLLAPGSSVEGTLADGQVDRYRLPPLPADSYLEITAEQHGADVALWLLRADGTALAADDSVHSHRAERLWAVVGDLVGADETESGGVEGLTIEVRPSRVARRSGSYTLRLAPPRHPSPRDRIRSRARLLMVPSAGADGAPADDRRQRLREAVELYRQAADPAGETAALVELAGVEDTTSPRAALVLLDSAAAVARDHGLADAQLAALLRAGRLRIKLGELEQAESTLESALSQANDLQDVYSQSLSLHNLAVLAETRGHYQTALERYHDLLPRLRELGTLRGQAAVLNNLATIHFELGDYAQALEYHRRVLPLRRRLEDVAGEAGTLSRIAALHHVLGRSEDALTTYRQALDLLRASGDRHGEADALNGIGLILDERGDHQGALDHHRRALEIARELEAGRIEAFAQEGIGRSRVASGDLEAGLEAHGRALEVRRRLGHRRGIAESLAFVAGVQRRLGRLQEATRSMAAAVEQVEALRTEVARDELRATFLASKHDYYVLLADLLLEQGRTGDALQVAERARARGLLDLMAESGVDLRHGVDPALLARERELLQAADEAEERRTRSLSTPHTPEQAAAVEAEVSSLLRQLQALRGSLRAASPRYAALTQPEPLGVDEIRRSLVDGGTVLLEYLLGTEASHLWVVTSDALHVLKLPPRREIDTAVRRLDDTLTARNRNPPGESAAGRRARLAAAAQEQRTAAADLAGMVLAPAARHLPAGARLAVVADGPLQYVPFAALPAADGRPLIADHEVVALPSASVLAEQRRHLAGRPAAPRSLLMLADPVFQPDDPRVEAPTPQPATTGAEAAAAPATLRADAPAGLRRLRFSGREADAVAALVPAGDVRDVRGFDASRETLLTAPLHDYRLLHFATHAVVDDREPERTGLVLSLVEPDGAPRNGFLRLHDVYNLELAAELVTLSACETALGAEIRGEGLVGLARGFMYAGAERVVASLWKVQDRATAELMGRFYRAILEDGLPPAAALRAAQRSMLAEERWADPYFWAPFVLQGEWR